MASAVAYNRGLGEKPPAKSKSRAPGRRVGERIPLKMKHF